MRIEMIGPPTAGKSQLVRTLVKKGITRGAKTSKIIIPDKWRDFADFIIKVYKNTTYKKLPDKTLMSLTLADVGSSTNKWVIYDELVMLCGFSMAIRIPEHAEEYFKNAPLPELLIKLTANENTLIKRNLKRGPKNRPEKTKRCIDAHKTFLPILEKRNCPILEFDTTSETSEKIANKIISKLSDFEGKNGRTK
jgi:thymidylate kinase